MADGSNDRHSFHSLNASNSLNLSQRSMAGQTDEPATPDVMASAALWTVDTPLLLSSSSISKFLKQSRSTTPSITIDHTPNGERPDSGVNTSTATSRQHSPRDITGSLPNLRYSELGTAGLGACAGLISCDAADPYEVYGIQNRADGCLVLGRPPSRHLSRNEADTNTMENERYTMSYKIDHDVQAKRVGKETMFDECVPCYNVEAERSLPGWIWSFFRSEAFLYTLHMTSIAVGAIKESMDLRENDAKLNLESSIIETLATLALIVIRMANARRGYGIVLRSLLHLENVRPDNAHLRAMKFWLYIYLTIAAGLALICTACFFIFYSFVHLGWTVLSNQFCLITIMVVSSLYISRVSAAVVQIREDQHKVVILEASLLLGRICEYERLADESENVRNRSEADCSNGLAERARQRSGARKEERQRLFEDVKRFLAALNHTSLFEKPTHIDVRSRTSVNVSMC